MKNSAIICLFCATRLKLSCALFNKAQSDSSVVNQYRSPNGAVTGASPAVQSFIKGIVYKDLITNWTATASAERSIGAIFLEANRDEVTYLRSLFTNVMPRVDFGTNHVVLSKAGVTDKLTQKPATLLWARVQAVTNNVATVRAGWYSSPESGEQLRYELTLGGLGGTNWFIKHRIRERIW